ncbi:MAG: hypothetical protein HC934_01235 [Acaryochloridaceae cyanobacterium SU_2_1]|nr:hypothetical protein [Acaryochloridaceae cyanobacterium SU_2_1]
MSIKPSLPRKRLNGKVLYRQADSSPSSSSFVVQAQPGSSTLAAGHRWAASIALLLQAGLVISTLSLAWLSFELITNPDVSFWFNQFLPINTNKATADQYQPLTLRQILKQLQHKNQTPGKPMILAGDSKIKDRLLTPTDLLIPLYQKSCDGSSCQQIKEIYVYRSLQLPALLRVFEGKRYYRPLDRMVAQGPSASDLSDLADYPRLLGSAHSLPLSRIERYQSAPQPGAWLRLTGLRSEGSGAASYGQIIYFHPDQAGLSLMLNWASPQGDFPAWQQVTGSSVPELVVNKSLGLEPGFAVYQVNAAAGGSLQMAQITLTKAALSDSAYVEGVMLARHGLWSLAMQRLTQVKRNLGKQWSASAQGQLDYIRLHAQVTEAQAQQQSANAVQTIVAHLVNGSWNRALEVLQAPQTDMTEVRRLLLTDSGRLLARVDAFLTVEPGDQDAIVWGAMIRYLQEPSPKARAWTQRQAANSPATRQRIQTLWNRLDKAVAPSPISEAVPRRPQPPHPPCP